MLVVKKILILSSGVVKLFNHLLYSEKEDNNNNCVVEGKYNINKVLMGKRVEIKKQRLQVSPSGNVAMTLRINIQVATNYIFVFCFLLLKVHIVYMVWIK